MSFDQLAIVGILLVMLVTYATERFRVELVAMAGLAAGFAFGVVPATGVFRGFATPAVITVAEVLLIVSALSSSRAVDDFARRILARTQSYTAVLAILCGTGAFVSIFMNNIGALALMFPVTLSVCARLNIAPGRMLMPLSFATLLTGTCSLTGTPANLIVNQWMAQETGRGMSYFELAWLGGPVALAGLVWLLIAAPRYFKGMEAAAAPFDSGPVEFLAELTVGGELAGLTLPEAEDRHEIAIHGVYRGGAHVFARRAEIVLQAGDLIVTEGNMAQLDALRDATPAADRVEAVVMPESLAIGSRLGDILAFEERGVRITGLASRRHRVEGRFAELLIGMGDVLVLSGDREAVREAVADSGLLPLSGRRPSAPRSRAITSVAVFGLGVLITAFNLLPTEIAFGGVVLALVLLGNLNLRSALSDMNWSIVLLLACMIPLGTAVEDTGAAAVIANTIAAHLPSATPLMVAATMLLVAVTITPFIDNVSTAVILSPIAAGLSARTGVAVEPLLMAVAIGASLDFLTPFGHHNNTVVMGAAGYRFMDFPRFGVPLLAVCVASGICTLAWLL
ncbi:MAG: SLC13 family permease [Candidatus Andeanibacterium colombiense]|uniref:SLC13 family permease n=1 Tax=Candidatus Andeanibacterium colombiense TaxID=3121345 RepID=A0AAJ5X815_9SPHN|nr:MAG: SLC13 family permease [Sphingomonadaceae bacterium]